MPGLRDILEAATSEGMTITEVAARIDANVWLEDHAPELAALVLDMGEFITEKFGVDGWLDDGSQALLARLDQLGKEPSDG